VKEDDMSSPAAFMTGVPGLDAVLAGGIPPGSLVMLVGAPGIGKTITASQIVFQAAQRGMSALIMTAYSESHLKLLSHLQGFTFFNNALIGSTITIVSLHSLVGETDEAFVTNVAATIRKSHAQLVFIDGLQGMNFGSRSDDGLRSLLSTLSTQSAFTNITMLVALAGDYENRLLYPQFTIADTIINFTFQRERRRHVRYCEVLKHRGAAPLPGQHLMTITNQGIEIFPRLESFPVPNDRQRPVGRSPFGLPELDELMNGGPTAGTTTILAGASGTGRTSLALRWALEQAAPEAQSVYVSFSEHVGELEQKAATLQIDLQAAQHAGVIHVLRFSPNQLEPDVVGSRLLPFLTSSKVSRLIIDDVTILIDVLGTRAVDFLAALDDHIYGEAITSLLVYEINAFQQLQINLANTAIGLFDENVLVLQKYQVGGSVYRVLAVLHMRYSTYDRTLREFVIDKHGIHVLSLEETQASPLPNVIGNITPPAPEAHDWASHQSG
jgi:circadian clock protein KaiC